jgi:hypothetical protein
VYHAVFIDDVNGNEEEPGVNDKKIADTNTGSRSEMVHSHIDLLWFILSI